MGALLTTNTSPVCSNSPDKQCKMHNPLHQPVVCCQLNPCQLSTQEISLHYKMQETTTPSENLYCSVNQLQYMEYSPVLTKETHSSLQETYESVIDNIFGLKHLHINCSSPKPSAGDKKRSFPPHQHPNNSRMTSHQPQIATISDGLLAASSVQLTTTSNTTCIRKSHHTISRTEILSPTSLSSTDISSCNAREESKTINSIRKICKPTSLKVDKDVKKSSSCYSLKLEHTPITVKGEMSEAMMWSTYAFNRGHQRKSILQGSTNELLKCLAIFCERRCPRIRLSSTSLVISWIRSVDRALILQGWADVPFLNPGNVVFLFMLLRDCVHEEMRSEVDLKTITLICLYISYSYMGNEISYPLKPFLLREEDRHMFWHRCLAIINTKSGDMLRLNADSVFFTRLFVELKTHAKR